MAILDRWLQVALATFTIVALRVNLGRMGFFCCLFNLPFTLGASSAVVYEIGNDVATGGEDFMWVDRNPYFEAAMALFNIEDTQNHDYYYPLPYAIL